MSRRWWFSRNIYKPPPLVTKAEADWLWNGDANPWLWKREEPSMSVKVEKIEPVPFPAPRFRIYYESSSQSYREWSESEARVIYEGLAEHFIQPITMGMASIYSERLAEKDAEIARLKEANAQWKIQHDQLAETCHGSGGGPGNGTGCRPPCQFD